MEFGGLGAWCVGAGYSGGEVGLGAGWGDYGVVSGPGLMAVHPPSTMSVCPVMCRASGDTRNNTAFAMSCTVAGLPMGVRVDQVFS